MSEYRSTEIDKLATALAKAQGQLTTVTANRQVTITTRAGSAYKYKYAPLSTILEAIRKPLADNGLSISQPIVGNELITVLMHESGQYISSSYALPRADDIKAFGANISYIRRYQIGPLVGIAVDEEDDENVAGETKTRKANPEPARQAQQRPPLAAKPNGNTSPAKADHPTNGDIPRKPQDLLDVINRRVEATYNELNHLMNGIKKELGNPDWAWPAYKDVDGWKAAYDAAYGHAVAKTKPIEATDAYQEMFDDAELDTAPRGGGPAYQD